ncbi:type II toxin-antitoxin system RelE/ParE family toxin [Gangjinia marincola]|uniref:Toxin n=1 Tax=Gangjinia marincola TaxID=578463 RepID=A0ABN1MEX0_9FLAO
MPKIVLRQQSIEDLNAIWLYTASQWSQQQADKYYTSIQDACNSIGEQPEIGRNYDAIELGLFGFKIGRHIIFYLFASTDKIEVIRILHERMDLKNRLRN